MRNRSHVGKVWLRQRRRAFKQLHVMFTLSPWFGEPPTRAGWYMVSLASTITARSYWCGRTWSAPVADDAPEAAFARARRSTWNLRGARPLWRGLTARGHARMAAELAL